MSLFCQDLKNKTEEAATLAKAEARAEASEKAATSAKADYLNITMYNKCLTEYKTAMGHALYRKHGSYYEPSDLQRIHDESKENSLKLVIKINQNILSNGCLLKFHYFFIYFIQQFRDKYEDGGQEIMLESRLESEIDTNYINFQHRNEWKRQEIQVCPFSRKKT